MICQLRHHYFGYTLSALLLSLFCTLSFTHNTYALDDINLTISDSQHLTNQIMCAPASWRNWDSCDGYKYLIFSNDSSDPLVSSSSSPVYLASNSSFNFGQPSLSSINFLIYSYDLTDSDYIRFSIGNYSSGTLNVTLSDNLDSLLPAAPSGSISITENGTYDVSSYSEASVNVPQEIVSEGQYHNDLISINNSILVCGAIILVIYFFYCIYRLIIKNSGVN